MPEPGSGLYLEQCDNRTHLNRTDTLPKRSNQEDLLYYTPLSAHNSARHEAADRPARPRGIFHLCHTGNRRGELLSEKAGHPALLARSASAAADDHRISGHHWRV